MFIFKLMVSFTFWITAAISIAILATDHTLTFKQAMIPAWLVVISIIATCKLETHK